MIAVGTFTPSALPDFIAKPVPFPDPWPFVWLPVTVAIHTRPLSDLGAKNLPGSAWLVVDPYVLLDAVGDPGAEGLLSVVASLLLSAGVAKPSTSPNVLSGLLTGFSFYRFTSQPFLRSLLRIRGG